MNFVGRLVLVVAAAVVAILVVVASGAFLASNRVTTEIEQARVSRLLGNLHSTTEANLSLGLTLDQVSSLQARIEREKASDTSLLAIDVFNAHGRSLYSTDRGAVGESVADSWTRRLAEDGIWSIPGRSETVFGTKFDNDLGLAGGIAVTVSDAARNSRNEGLFMDLLNLTGIAILASVAVTSVATLGFAVILTRPFERVARALRGEDIPPPAGQSMEQLAVQTRRAWTKAEERIDAGIRKLEALDDAS